MELTKKQSLFPEYVFGDKLTQFKTPPSSDSSRKYSVDDLKGFEILAGAFYHLLERHEELSKTDYELEDMDCIYGSMNLIIAHTSTHFPDLTITDSKASIKHYFVKK
jgi:hypothetical protein